MQWNSLGPFIVWYTVGSSAIWANEAISPSGHSERRHRWRR